MRTAMDVSNEASPSDVASFAVGDTFSSYDDLKKKLAEFEKSHSVQLTQRDSRTLEAAARRVPMRVKNANTALVYYSISFSCVFGGKKYNSKGSGKRPHQRYTELIISRWLWASICNCVYCLVFVAYAVLSSESAKLA